MSTPPRRLTAVLAALVVALAATPATVLAQNGAGDEQYVDPLAGSGSGSGGGGSGSSGSSGTSSGTSSGSTSGSSSGQVAPSTSSGTTAGTTTGATTQGTAAGQLPRTGADLRLPIGAGIVLLVAGLLLWRRRPGDGRA